MSRKQKRIFHYISKHPGCSAQDISKRMNVTHNTIYRQIARLKQQGLIEHVGANKTGGYEAVEEEMG
ncbi:MAG: MarR family transcriptional regulator [Bacteroidales bacterium]|nr:MarR family transcriptional regulator [Bacteroidales bacterium]